MFDLDSLVVSVTQPHHPQDVMAALTKGSGREKVRGLTIFPTSFLFLFCLFLFVDPH